MFGLDYMTLASTARERQPEWMNIGLTNRRALSFGTARLVGIHFKFGEVNRYSKGHQNPISIDHVSVEVPQAVRETEHEEFKHFAIPPEEEAIRLLELLPARASKAPDFIACRLHKRRLGDVHGQNFETLSYTWGKRARDVPIFILPDPLPANGKINTALSVTPQLYAALRRLRYQDTSRFLWIDQICIDQTNGEEKGHQVLLMGQIYAFSTRTIIWLGEEDEHRSRMEKLLTAISGSPDRNSDIRAVKNLVEDKTEGENRLHAITNFLNRDFFTRAWIFQEAVLGRQLIVRFGGLEIPFDNLKRLVDAVKELQYNTGGYAQSIMKTTVGYDTLDLIQHARHPGSCHDELCILFKEQLQPSPSERDTEKRPNFLQILFEALLRFSATDDRDLIYAFLSSRFQRFSPSNDIIPDYSTSVTQVWTNAAHCIIAETQTLDIFAAARGNESPKYEDLPSWVPDWSDCFRFARPIYAPDFRSSFNACHGRPHMSDIVPDNPQSPYELLIRGKAIRSIAWRSPLNFETSYYRSGAGISTFLDVATHVNDVRNHLTIQRNLSGEAVSRRWPDLRSTVLRTLLADGAFGHIQPLERDGVVSMKELDRIIEKEAEIVEMKARIEDRKEVPNVNRWRSDYAVLEKLWQWALVAQRKVLFMTRGLDGAGVENIEMGIAGADVRDGDAVLILHGSRVPVVLRRVEGGQGRWRVISQAYVQGWMYGDERVLGWEEEEADEFVLV
jgi:Heterokaryon incompatibility protein (HET)